MFISISLPNKYPTKIEETMTVSHPELSQSRTFKIVYNPKEGIVKPPHPLWSYFTFVNFMMLLIVSIILWILFRVIMGSSKPHHSDREARGGYPNHTYGYYPGTRNHFKAN